MQKKKNRIKPPIKKKNPVCPGHMRCCCLSPLLCLSLLLWPCHLLLGLGKLQQPGVGQPWMSVWHLMCISLSLQPWSNPSLGPPVSLDVDIKEGEQRLGWQHIWYGRLVPSLVTHASEQLSQWATTTEPKRHNYWSPHVIEPLLHSRRGHCDEKPVHFD